MPEKGQILPEIAWNCLILPEIAWKGAWIRLKRRKQFTMTWRPESDWFCLMCFLSENAGKEWGRWATLLPRAVGLNIIGKQTLIMNVSIWFLLFEGIYFCFREIERESAWPLRFRPRPVGRRVTQELLTARASVLLKPLPYGFITFFWLLKSISSCGMDIGNAQLGDHCWGNEHAVQAACLWLILPGLAWNCLILPDAKKVKNQET